MQRFLDYLEECEERRDEVWGDEVKEADDWFIRRRIGNYSNLTAGFLQEIVARIRSVGTAEIPVISGFCVVLLFRI